MEEYKISKFDYKKQKELLSKYIGQNIIYNGLIYELIDFFEYTNKISYIKCVLRKDRLKSITVPINIIFEICYPNVLVT